MPTFGQLRRHVEYQRKASDLRSADFYADLWSADLEIFETRAPRGKFEQIQWLRVLGKIASEFGASKSEEDARLRREFREYCRLSMLALREGLPDAAGGIRWLAREAPNLLPRRVSAHFIAARIADSLGPRRRA